MRLRGFLSLGATACFFGLGVVLAKALTAVLNPVLLGCLALAAGGLLIASVLVLRRRPLVPHLSLRGWGTLLLLAVVGTSAPLLLVIFGFEHTNAVASGVLIQAQGPIGVLFAAVWLHERPSPVQVVGTALVVVGSAIAVWRPGVIDDVLLGSWQTDLAGPLLILAGAVGYGFAFIPAKVLTQQADALQISALRLLLGAVAVTPLLFFQPTLIVGVGPQDLGSIAAIAVLYVVTNYGLAYILQQDGLRFLKAWEAAVVMQTIPLFAALSAILFFRETLTAPEIVGGLCVIVGGIVVARGGRREAIASA